MIFEFFVRKPVFTLVISLLLVLFGLVSLNFLSVRETPNIQAPVVTVTTVWFGADPALMESDVTEILERQINGIEGIRTITSTSSEQQSTISVEFELNRSLEEAANDVRSRVSRARRDLPPDVEEPVVEKSEADSQPVVFLRLDAQNRSLLELSEMSDVLVRERLQSILGVGSVSIYGEQVYAIRIDLDPHRLSARGISVADIEAALDANHVNAPAGRIEGKATELSIRLEGDLRTVDEFKDLVVREIDGRPVRLGDLGEVRLGAENERSAARSDGRATVTVAVLPQANANIIDISDEIRRRLPSIQKDLPDDVKVMIGYDRSQAVRTSIAEVEETLLIAFGLVVLVIFAFLRDFRSTLVPALAIPVSLVGTFSFLWLVGFSINVFTLFGLVLAIGLVVDDAIVVLENVYRHIEEGMEPFEAAIVGTKQIAFAVIATTLALVAVFIPVIFTGGTSGRLFLEFGSTVAVSVILSAVVALTLTPMLCARLLKGHVQRGAFYRITGRMLDGMNRGFGSSLRVFLRFPALAVAVTAITLAIGGLSYRNVPREFFPIEDRNLILVRTLAAEGTAFDYMDARMKELEPELMAAVPERTSVLTRIGAGPGGTAAAANTGMFILPLVPREERTRSQAEILNDVKKRLGGVTAFMTIPVQPTTVGRGFGSPVQFVIQNADFEKLAAELPHFVAEMRKIPGLTSINPDLKLNRPELLLTIDREKAAAAGVSIRDVGRSLQVLSGGRELAHFKRGTRQYPVIAQLQRKDRRTSDDLFSVQVRSAHGDMIPLSNLLHSTEKSAAASRYHYNRAPSATISANLDGITLGQALDQISAVAEKELPEGFRTALAGESKDFEESNAALSLVLILALLLVFLILAAQFDSFTDPISILLGAPLALAGAFASLWITGTSLSFFSQVGLILLVGLVTKNGILIVEYARQLREEKPDLGAWEAAEQATLLRFRPILMTSVATIGGALPIALGFSSASRAPLGVVVVGGMAVATVLSLYVTPVFYAAISRGLQRRKPIPVVAAATSLLALFWAGSAQADPLTLQQALSLSLAHNRNIAGAGLETEAAKATVGITRSGLLPSLGLQANANTSLQTSGMFKEIVGKARLDVPLLDLSTVYAVAADFHRAKGASAAEEAQIEAALAETAASFAAVQKADQALATAHLLTERSLRLLTIAEDRVSVGLSPPIDVPRARLRWLQDKQREITAQADREAAELTLVAQIGLDPAPLGVAPVTPWSNAALPTDDDLYLAIADSRRNHPDWEAAEHTFWAVHLDRKSHEFTWAPTLGAYAESGVYASDAQRPTPTAEAGLTASLPIFTGLGRAAAIRRSRALEARAELSREDIGVALETSLRTSLITLRQTRQGLDVAAEAQKVAEQELAFAEERYVQGLTDNSPVVEAQARASETALSHIDAIAAFNLAFIDWMAAQGRVRDLAGQDQPSL